MRHFDFYQPVDYNYRAKDSFHRTVRSRLRATAKALGLPSGTYTIDSNKAGDAVSGEIILRGEYLYVVVSQPCTGDDNGILIRSSSRGGMNYFAPLQILNEPEKLAASITRLLRLDHTTEQRAFRATTSDYRFSAAS